jgi:DNA processing protein
VATSFGRRLAESGVTVVSGLARGVDAAAHRGALEAGVTVAVLGCGIDRDYPRSHAGLAERIAERGLIVSEYPPGVEPAPWRFPARNRIVAGLCRAAVVVEARARSGALITADLALEEGREVLAVPGEITNALSHGTNALLRLGAIPATCPEDVLEAIGVEPSAPEPAAPISATGAAVLAGISDGPAAVDEIVRRAGLTAAVTAAALAELELSGFVAEGDGLYRGVITGGGASQGGTAGS